MNEIDTSIKIRKDTVKKLNQFKYNIGAKSLDDVIQALIKTVNQIKLASEIKKKEESK